MRHLASHWPAALLGIVSALLVASTIVACLPAARAASDAATIMKCVADDAQKGMPAKDIVIDCGAKDEKEVADLVIIAEELASAPAAERATLKQARTEGK